MTTTPRRAPVLLASLLASTTLVAVGSSAPAGADVIVVHDRAGGSDVGDVAKVRINHQRRQLIVLSSAPRGGFHPEYPTYWVDTGRGAGPDFRVVADGEFEGLVVYTTRGFGDTGGREVCNFELGSQFDRNDNTQKNRARIPSRCLGFPRRVRVSVQLENDFRTTDWVPGRRQFTRWVARG